MRPFALEGPVGFHLRASPANGKDIPLCDLCVLSEAGGESTASYGSTGHPELSQRRQAGCIGVQNVKLFFREPLAGECLSNGRRNIISPFRHTNEDLLNSF